MKNLFYKTIDILNFYEPSSFIINFFLYFHFLPIWEFLIGFFSITIEKIQFNMHRRRHDFF